MILGTGVLGTLPTWILVVIALGAAWRMSRGGTGSAVSELSKANEVLDKRLHEERQKREDLGAEVADLRTQNAELKGRTDFAAALAAALGPLSEWTIGHETRAQERHEAAMKNSSKNTEAVLLVLDRIAERLGPDDLREAAHG